METKTIQPRKTPHYGWRPQLPDFRDYLYSDLSRSLDASVVKVLPPSADLTSGFGPVVDQGELGSCTANAGAAIFGFMLKKQNLSYFDPSRLFIYYNERLIEGTVSEDSGAQVRDCLKVLATYGVCPEKELPYNIAKFTHKPTKKDYTDAKKDLAITYQAVTNSLIEIKTSLAAGYPVIIGFTVYESFESDTVAQTGIVPMPAKTEQVLGGHCVVIVGYDDNNQRFKLRNSWGTGWGQEGYFTMPYPYISNKNLASDFWTLRKVVK